MRLRLFLAFVAIVAAAPAAMAMEPVHYVCADKTELTATFHMSPSAAHLVFAGSGETMNLPQAPSADGGRYVKCDTEFWIKGRDATLTRGDSQTTCKS
ncbi:MliC family protein [Hyphomicrobium sp. B1]|uniref:MliC family protein n=1 Tax=Hyphomicrobium sp. B1 TaxID=3075651 RepID=UPI003C2ABDD2